MLNCGEFNTNKVHCERCNALISHQVKRETRAIKIQEKEIGLAQEELEKLNLPDRLRKHPFFIVNIAGWILHSVWIVLTIIGGFAAWFIAMVAAG
jgi:predicted anti-sigma-YlaC factor YlaD